ncbi:biofilm regulation phosphoprotein SiaC [Marinomonas ostreistagni]|uniref:biofilm regulation phosphoprotein SiaC n=1 Tax=Marinomonas ostreistagni TaxID=359209 RepID=UPI00194FDD06|nr:biofilm regulation phosphoprotein SiaC [Marinomonas ostreistagni]MBM6552274.1 biofilm regulation phosphoprotein SiaC [Marinomonas ostreistagni]
MNDLKIVSTQSTPLIETDSSRGVIYMEGDSYPENSFEFYTDLVNWVSAYLNDSQRPLVLELALLYLNTSSIKVMMDIFDELEEAHQGGRDITVNWRYDVDNERVAELAEEFKEDCSFAFNIIGQE